MKGTTILADTTATHSELYATLQTLSSMINININIRRTNLDLSLRPPDPATLFDTKLPLFVCLLHLVGVSVKDSPLVEASSNLLSDRSIWMCGRSEADDSSEL